MDASVVPTHGSKAADYYYTSNVKGVRSYYSKITGGRIAKHLINATYINDVKERTNQEVITLTSDQLLKEKQKHLDTIVVMNAKIKAIDEKLEKMGIRNETDVKKVTEQKAVFDREAIKRKEEFRKEREEILRRLFEKFGYKESNTNNASSNGTAPNGTSNGTAPNGTAPNGTSNNTSSNGTSNASTAYGAKTPYPPDILSRYSITVKKEWHKWLLKHHEDKGGNVEICKFVIAAGKDKGW